ncbi:deoxyribose-phosphate aldolase [Nocardioides panacis]|uniref:deoxyribose-phosphate aldolase n=1 Tax=Nocardioides panacis TaxID=2849501 RepID=UPI0020B25E8E|nr:deoxyribose-phosphate aldolase [Nocardioides panacis]
MTQTLSSTASSTPDGALPGHLAEATSSDASLRRFLHGLPGVDQVGAEARAASLGTRSIKTTAKAFALDLAVRMVDLTTLEGSDTPGKVRALCSKAMRPDPADPSCPAAAAVCVYPDMVATAKQALAGSGVRIASVATAFPSGRAARDIKLADTRDAVEAGADEIDMVIDRGAFLSGRYLDVFEEIVAVREACGDAHLKVIFETGELQTYDNVRRVSWLAMMAGAHFIKTSTGKIQPAATLPVTMVMLEAVRDYRAATGQMVGVEARRRHPHRQGRDQVPRDGQRGGRPGLAGPGLVPLRRLHAPQRPAHAAHQDDHRPLLRSRLLHAGLIPCD